MATDTQHISVVTEAPTLPLVADKPHGSLAAGSLRSVRARVLAAPPVRFLLHLLEMQIAMALGMGLFKLLLLGLPASPAYRAAFATGADLWILGDGLFMSVPMVAWMVWRGHGWRLSLEMGAAMLGPGLAIIVLGWLGAGTYLPWLATSACGVMCLGMLVYMLARYKHFTGHTGHGLRSVQPNGAATEACH
jgi:hypothetical protein